MWDYIVEVSQYSISLWAAPILIHYNTDTIPGYLAFLLLDSTDNFLLFIGENLQIFSAVCLNDKVMSSLTPLLGEALYSLYLRSTIVLNKTQALTSQTFSPLKKALAFTKSLFTRS